MLALVKKHGPCPAREITAIYREETGDLPRSNPRMALLSLMDQGKIAWDSNGMVSLIEEERNRLKRMNAELRRADPIVMRKKIEELQGQNDNQRKVIQELNAELDPYRRIMNQINTRVAPRGEGG